MFEDTYLFTITIRPSSRYFSRVSEAEARSRLKGRDAKYGDISSRLPSSPRKNLATSLPKKEE